MRDFLSRFLNPAGADAVRVDPHVRYQTVEGWGTSLAWWGHVVGGWQDAPRTAIADLLFDPAAGLGLNIVRYNIGGGDDPAHAHMRPGGDIPGYQPSPGVWDWSADANQRRVLQEARQRGVAIVEAFSNSPPYWMTHSGCAAGAADGGNNLRDDYVNAFAAYLAEVAAHFRDDWDTAFRSVEPFNEPAASNWKRMNRQEGCHVSPDQQAAVIAQLSSELAARGLAGSAISAPDDYSVDQAVGTVGGYEDAVMAQVAQVNTHSYEGSRRADLRDLVARHGKRLWMSEYGTGVGQHDHNSMQPALKLSSQIRGDMTALQPAAWVYWQAVEAEHGHNSNWGFLHADFGGADEQYWLTKQYYAMGQYSKFIRPGYQLIAVDDERALAAHDVASGTLAIVFDNAGQDELRLTFDLSRFERERLGPSAAAYHTSRSENLARLPDLPLSGSALAVTAPAQSITTLVVTGVQM